MRVRDEPCCWIQAFAFLLDRSSAFFRDRPGHTAAMLQMFIRRVDNGIHFFNRDVALNDLQGLTCWKNMFIKMVFIKIFYPVK